jgi:hypothetical protein
MRNLIRGAAAVVVIAGCLTMSMSASAVAPGVGTADPAASNSLAFSISPTTLHLGDHPTVSGTGCLDPATHSGSGLWAGIFRITGASRGGPTYGDIVQFPVAADGSFSGTYTVAQPLEDIAAQVTLKCSAVHGGDPRYWFPVVSTANTTVQLVAPPLPDMRANAGGLLSFTLPCNVNGQYETFSMELSAPGHPKVSLDLSQTTRAQAGVPVSIPVPADTPPAVYAATAACVASESSQYAGFGHFTVTIEPAAPAQPTTSVPLTDNEPPAPAPAAAPVAGQPAFTG